MSQASRDLDEAHGSGNPNMPPWKAYNEGFLAALEAVEAADASPDAIQSLKELALRIKERYDGA